MILSHDCLENMIDDDDGDSWSVGHIRKETDVTKKNLAREDTRLPFLLKELLWQNEHFVTRVKSLDTRV